MKKIAAILVALVLVAPLRVSLAHQGGQEDKAGLFAKVSAKIQANSQKENDRDEKEQNEKNPNNFVVIGTVKSVSGSNLVVTVEFGGPVQDLKGKDVTIKTNADTDFRVHDKDSKGAISEIAVGSKVIVKGQKNGSDYVAKWVQAKKISKVSGEVTAKTATTLTIKNNITGATVTVPVTSDTRVMINGESRAVSDIQVGDKGFAKVKTKLGAMVTKFVNLFR